MRATSLAWLERLTDNQEVASSNLAWPIRGERIGRIQDNQI